MKISLLLSSLLMLGFTGCSDSSSQSGDKSPASEGSVLTAPVDYLESAAKAKHSADKTVDAASLSKAIEMFSVQEGRYPNDLNELVAKKVIPAVPPPPAGMKFDYDAKTGTLKVVQQ